MSHRFTGLKGKILGRAELAVVAGLERLWAVGRRSPVSLASSVRAAQWRFLSSSVLLRLLGPIRTHVLVLRYYSRCLGTASGRTGC